jgi:hypothetical protein
VGSLLGLLFRNLVPYWDPGRRLRIRRAARALVSSRPWPGDQATAQDVAELVLLRLLWLQSQAHRAGQLRQAEATMLLSRAAVEACIAGLYWLQTPEAAIRLAGGNALALQRMLAYIFDDNPVDRELLDVTTVLGDPKALPDLRAMANAVAMHTNDHSAAELYRRIYIPLSTFVPHPTGVALLRHVRARDKVSEAPASVWSIRAALHATDACVASLAIAIADRAGAPTTDFKPYAESHMSRTVAPVFAVATRTAFRTVHWSQLPVMFQSVRELRRYYHSGEAARDSYPERKAKTADALERALQALGGDVPDEFRKRLVDRAADTIAADPAVS